MVVKVVGTITKWCYKIIAFLLVLVIVKIIICPKVIYYIYIIWYIPGGSLPNIPISTDAFWAIGHFACNV